MNLLFINSIGKKKWGGGEKWMILAAKGLIEKGHNVTIACFPNSELEAKAGEAGIPVFSLSIITDFSYLAYRKLKKYLQVYPTDIIIGCQNKDVRLAGFIARKRKNLTVLSRQGVELLSNKIKYKYTFVPFCDGIITNTKTIKNKYDNFGWWSCENYVKVIHNGVEQPGDSIQPFNYSSYIPEGVANPFIVISTGRLTEQKGFKYLIDAAGDIIKKYPNVYFFIAGKGKLESLLKRQVESLKLDKHFHFLGFQTDIPSLLVGADLFVLPSLYEGMPNSVMEAMTYGVPVISTDVNGVGELMVDKKHGLIIPSANVGMLRSALDEMISQNNLAAIGAEGQKHVQEYFSISAMADNLESYLYAKLKERQANKKLKRFLIIQTAFIGDVILATPVVEKLKRFYPEAQIDILVRQGNQGILKNNPYINNVIIFNKVDGKYKNMLRLIKQFRSEKYDYLVNVQRYLTTGFITAFSGAKQTIGFDKNPMSFAFTHKVKHKMEAVGYSIHEVERNLSLIEHLTDTSFEMPKMYPSDEDFKKVEQDKKYYCLAPTSVWFTKQYPADKWVELMDNLPHNTCLIVLGGPGDKEDCQSIINKSTHPDIQNMAGMLSFTESAALMKKAEMNFVNDSAPLHICSAVNAPVRAMFCSTVPAYGYTPLSDNSKVIEIGDDLDCRPCGLHGKKVCPKGHFKCGNISAGDIIDSMKRP